MIKLRFSPVRDKNNQKKAKKVQIHKNGTQDCQGTIFGRTYGQLHNRNLEIPILKFLCAYKSTFRMGLLFCPARARTKFVI